MIGQIFLFEKALWGPTHPPTPPLGRRPAFNCSLSHFSFFHHLTPDFCPQTGQRDGSYFSLAFLSLILHFTFHIFLWPHLQPLRIANRSEDHCGKQLSKMISIKVIIDIDYNHTNLFCSRDPRKNHFSPNTKKCTTSKSKPCQKCNAVHPTGRASKAQLWRSAQSCVHTSTPASSAQNLHFVHIKTYILQPHHLYAHTA